MHHWERFIYEHFIFLTLKQNVTPQPSREMTDFFLFIYNWLFQSPEREPHLKQTDRLEWFRLSKAAYEMEDSLKWTHSEWIELSKATYKRNDSLRWTDLLEQTRVSNSTYSMRERTV